MHDATVVIPAYNHAEFLGEAIESALSSRAVNVEVIVVDDGSTDATREVATTFEDVRYVRQPNGGAHSAINRGVELATHDLVAVLNDDDCYLPNHLAAALEALDTGSSAPLVLTTPSIIGSGELLLRMMAHQKYSRRMIARYGLAGALLRANWFVGTSAMVMSRMAWRELGGFRPHSMTHDHDFALRAVCSDRISVTAVMEPTWLYRCHGSNSVLKLNEEHRQSEFSETLEGLRIVQTNRADVSGLIASS